MNTGTSSAWHARPSVEAAEALAANLEFGLTSAEAHARLEKHGPNRLRPEKHEPIWEIFLEELREPLILLLLATGVLYALWGEITDALVIFAVILALNTVEVVNEHRAGQAIAALRRMAEPTAAVLRNGRAAEVPAEEVVPVTWRCFRRGAAYPPTRG